MTNLTIEKIEECTLEDLKINDIVHIKHAHILKDSEWTDWSTIRYKFTGKTEKGFEFWKNSHPCEIFIMRENNRRRNILLGKIIPDEIDLIFRDINISLLDDAVESFKMKSKITTAFLQKCITMMEWESGNIDSYTVEFDKTVRILNQVWNEKRNILIDKGFPHIWLAYDGMIKLLDSDEFKAVKANNKSTPEKVQDNDN